MNFVGMNIYENLKQRMQEIKKEKSNSFQETEKTWDDGVLDCLNILNIILEESNECPIIHLNGLSEMQGTLTIDDIEEIYK